MAYHSLEVHLSHTDPKRADTDRNGIPDSAEDLDGDGLSNLSEQRLHTNPLLADTDANGLPDGAEDTNHDGALDGPEQDSHRPVPPNLKPSLKEAADDRPISYADRCHVGANEDRFKECNYGPPDGTLRIALLGGSHAAQWLPSLIKLADARGWTIENLTRAACPFADVHEWTRYQHGVDTHCASFRQQARDWLTANPPDLIVLASLAGERLVNAKGTYLTPPQARKAWRRGFVRTLAAFPAASKVLVLSDTPYSGVNPVTCLKAHRASLGACERQRASQVPRPTTPSTPVSRQNTEPFMAISWRKPARMTRAPWWLAT